MKKEGCPFKGCLYFGLILTEQGPKVIEYNCRFGDPETQVVLPLLKTDLFTIMRAVRDEHLSELDIQWSTGAAACVVLASGCLLYTSGTKVKHTVLEYCYKDDALGDPLVNDYHIYAMGIATKEELDLIAEYSVKINKLLSDYLKDLNIELIDYKIEFGKTPDGTIILADEISPDTCRFWDSNTGEKLDKDRFRRDLGNVEGAYHEIMKRDVYKRQALPHTIRRL